jgi:hypothetical protein
MKFTSAVLLLLGAVCAQQGFVFDTAANVTATSIPYNATARENVEEENRKKKRKSMTQ